MSSIRLLDEATVDVEDDENWDADPEEDTMTLSKNLSLVRAIQCECTGDLARRRCDGFLAMAP